MPSACFSITSNLTLLRVDDLAGQLLDLLVAGAFLSELGHPDCAFVMTDHHLGEGLVDILSGREIHSAVLHAGLRGR